MARKEAVSFYSGLSYKLAGVLVTPDDMRPGEKRPAIVVCHGYASWKERYSIRIAEELANAGYVSLAFDYRGFGESEGPRWRLMCLEQVEDIRNAITYMETRQEVDTKKIGLIGISLGGANVVYTGAVDKRPACIVSIVAVGDGERWLHSVRRDYEWVEFKKKLKKDDLNFVLTGKSELVHPLEIEAPPPDWREIWDRTFKEYPERMKMQFPLETARSIIEFKPDVLAGAISPRPLLVISDPNDTVVPPQEQVSIFEHALEPKKFISEEAEGHILYDKKGFELLLKHSIEWFDRYIPIPAK